MRRYQATIAVIALLCLAVALQAPSARARRSPLNSRSFAVIAVVDSGINPYHVDFRRPDLNVHPSRYIEGFPRDAPALRLSLDSKTLEAAHTRDREAWSSVKEGRLVWIPGTNIVGAIGLGCCDEPIFDEVGHGTMVASVAGGMIHGPRRDDILIVAVEGTDVGLQWAAEQPWIDVITNSWSNVLPVVDRTAEASYAAVAEGKVVCFASGNLSAPLWFWEGQGPSWHVNVGAASIKTRGEHYYTGYPNDVLGLAGMDAASADSMDGTQQFAGTSAATPWVCSRIAQTLADVRRRLGDTREGPHEGGLAVGKKMRGHLRDGVLDRDELEDAVQVTATPAATAPPDSDDPNSIPAAPIGGFVRGGYGIVDDDTIREALKVIFGAVDRPERTAEDAWIATTDLFRNAMWGDPP